MRTSGYEELVAAVIAVPLLRLEEVRELDNGAGFADRLAITARRV